MERLDADFLVVDLLSHGSPHEYTIRRLTGIDIRSTDITQEDD